ncbi:MAG: 1-deoxy-D-xylulose-5-phosphate reductoisomerase [Treponema sp.]|jgi:1-deoxy-D-xylulose-5-phosphate reductoisomerase|nr:1-deoxy-D-xylulose-5-phosphate reductoisomerase [Treponema sp.]
MKKRISILGATGSIGKSSLDVISRNRDEFDVVLLAARSSRQEMEKLKNLWPGAVCVLTGEEGGKEKLFAAIGSVNADITINGISGAAGLEPSLAAIEAGSDLALANKETVVMAAPLVFRIAKEKNIKIIPVDSEHSAIFHLIQAHAGGEKDVLSEIILTASGGPFRKMNLADLKKVTAKDALAHPTWKMGPKITIDSASMANKGLEIIEACALFDMPQEKINVVIHPQSIVHSMVKLRNGAVYAQLSKPDMRNPIHDALFWPKTVSANFDTINFDSLTLEFEKPDTEKFPMLKLARESASLGGLYPCVYNAANEEAVTAFLENKIGFLEISGITKNVLDENWDGKCGEKEAVLNADELARKKAIFYINKNI